PLAPPVPVSVPGRGAPPPLSLGTPPPSPLGKPASAGARAIARAADSPGSTPEQLESAIDALVVRKKTQTPALRFAVILITSSIPRVRIEASARARSARRSRPHNAEDPRAHQARASWTESTARGRTRVSIKEEKPDFRSSVLR